jgi:VNT family MFS transporter (synaptic vesicle glycoprotein 2)
MCWQAGFGYSQWMLMLVSGLGLVADAAELLVIPFILPSAEVELCINAAQKTWLSKYSAVVLCTSPILMSIHCKY